METREYKLRDLKEIKSLWLRCFNDTEEFVDGFFERLHDMGSCVVGEEGGRIVAMASVLCGQELQFGGSLRTPECGYIYALAVDEHYRGKGLGESIAKAAYDLALKREAAIVCTLPADEKLYSFYEKTLGFKPVLFRERYEIDASDAEMTMELNATEYNMMREDLLRGSTYLRLSYFSMDFLSFLCKSYGGGLYAGMSGICACTVDGETCVISEIISQNPKDTAASVAAKLGCKKAVYYMPSTAGQAFIASDSTAVPIDTLWNIAYE